jgi:hypothetical protein
MSISSKRLEPFAGTACASKVNQRFSLWFPMGPRAI